jgi:hypothetical protein
MRLGLRETARRVGLDAGAVLNSRRVGALAALGDTSAGVGMPDYLLLLSYARLKTVSGANNTELGEFAATAARKAETILHRFLDTGELAPTLMVIATAPSGERRHFFADIGDELAQLQVTALEAGFVLVLLPLFAVARDCAQAYGLVEPLEPPPQSRRSP